MDEISKTFYESVNQFFGEYNLYDHSTDKPTDLIGFFKKIQPIWEDLGFCTYNLEFQGIYGIDRLENGFIKLLSKKSSLVFLPDEINPPESTKNNQKEDEEEIVYSIITTKGEKKGLEQRIKYQNKHMSKSEEIIYINGPNVIAVYPQRQLSKKPDKRKVLMLEKILRNLKNSNIDFEIDNLKKKIQTRYIFDEIGLPYHITHKKIQKYWEGLKEDSELERLMRSIYGNSNFIIEKKDNLIHIILGNLDRKKKKILINELDRRFSENVCYVDKDEIEFLNLSNYLDTEST